MGCYGKFALGLDINHPRKCNTGKYRLPDYHFVCIKNNIIKKTLLKSPVIAGDFFMCGLQTVNLLYTHLK
jgi:hypothetical protein